MNKKEWLDKCLHWKNKWDIYNPEYSNDEYGINLYDFIYILNEYLPLDCNIVCDAGSAIYATAQALKLKSKGQRYCLSGGQADMGFALPASIGAYLSTEKDTLVITGDGSFNTNIQELAVIKKFQLPIKIFVWNNNGYLSIRNTQKNFFNGNIYGTDSEHGVWFPELCNVARTYELDYRKISSRDSLKEHLQSIINFKFPLICEIICDPNQNIIPTVAPKKKKDGSIEQPGLNDMFPFLSDEELEKETTI